MTSAKEILSYKPVFDCVCKHLNINDYTDEDKINFSVSIGMLDHLFKKATKENNSYLIQNILCANVMDLSDEILDSLSVEQWASIGYDDYNVEYNYDRIPEDFLRKYKHKVNWKLIC